MQGVTAAALSTCFTIRPVSHDDRRRFPVNTSLFGRALRVCGFAQCTRLLTELDPDRELAFGLCDLGMGEPELGYVSLTELRTVRGRLGLPVERDLPFDADKTLAVYADEARERGHIVTSRFRAPGAPGADFHPHWAWTPRQSVRFAAHVEASVDNCAWTRIEIFCRGSLVHY
jgi:hypothetical protein